MEFKLKIWTDTNGDAGIVMDTLIFRQVSVFVIVFGVTDVPAFTRMMG